MFLPPETFRLNYISQMLFELLFLHPFQESPGRVEVIQRKRQKAPRRCNAGILHALHALGQGENTGLLARNP